MVTKPTQSPQSGAESSNTTVTSAVQVVQSTEDKAAALLAFKTAARYLRLRDYLEEINIESSDFHIDSSNWPEYFMPGKTLPGVTVRIHPEGGVYEFMDEPSIGKQLFTPEAAIREAARSGKRLVTHAGWLDVINKINPSIQPKDGWQVDGWENDGIEQIPVRIALGLNLTGYILESHTGNQSPTWYYRQQQAMYLGIQDETGKHAHVLFTKDKINPTSHADNGTYACSVRVYGK